MIFTKGGGVNLKVIINDNLISYIYCSLFINTPLNGDLVVMKKQQYYIS
jgi:hypothetical protein